VKRSGKHLTPAGNRGKVETPQAKPRRLDFLPAESKCLERNGTILHIKSNKVCENSQIAIK
jgi:hypothetical protein